MIKAINKLYEMVAFGFMDVDVFGFKINDFFEDFLR